MPNKNKIIIVGGGLSGLLTAVALKNIGEITLIDPNINKPYKDFRTTAISHGSSLFLEKLGIWKDIKELGAIDKIKIFDNEGERDSVFSSDFENNSHPMGYIIENKYIISAYKKALPKGIAIVEDFVSSIDKENNQITLKSGDQHKFDILIAADGRNSFVREHLNINTRSKSYKQSAMVSIVEHEKPHNNIAVERFTAAGPLAILPMADQHKSSIVWSEENEIAKKIFESDDFQSLLERGTSKDIGKITKITDRAMYPLSLKYMRKMVHNDIIFIGDAAHAIHPIAGQGYNLTIRDIEALKEKLEGNISLGFALKSGLEQFSSSRMRDIYKLIAATDGLNSLFSTDNFAVKALRRVGVGIFSKSTKVKDYTIKYAMGLG